MAVAQRTLDEPESLQIPQVPTPGPWAAVVRGVERAVAAGRPAAQRPNRLERGLRLLESPSRFADWRQGRENFDHLGTARILGLLPSPPDVLHCHNLHGNYFDLRQLAPLSRTLPVLLTLHDEWAYTGHCGGTLGCERWRTGCGSCPDLTIYPAIRRDATAANWIAKRDIYRESRLYVSGPSNWLVDRARDSMLAEGTVRWRVIPNGVDRSVFKPGSRLEARAQLGLPADDVILLFAADFARSSSFKDYGIVLDSARRVAAALTERRISLVVLGDGGDSERSHRLDVRFVPYERDLTRVAGYYQAADLLLHAAKAETGGLTIVEALATGLPVVATGIGGIPEVVRSLTGAPGAWPGPGTDQGAATGVLVPPGDAVSMAAAASFVLSDEAVLHELSRNAIEDVAQRFDIDRFVQTSVDWYREIREDWSSRDR